LEDRLVEIGKEVVKLSVEYHEVYDKLSEIDRTQCTKHAMVMGIFDTKGGIASQLIVGHLTPCRGLVATLAESTRDKDSLSDMLGLLKN
jgi:hypothetical protein